MTRAEFDQTLSEWKGILIELRKVSQYDYAIAYEHELEGIREQKDKLVAEGNRLYGKAINLAAQLYPESGDEDLLEFLRSVRTRLLDLGHFDSALKVGLAILEGGSGESRETDLGNMMALVQIANFCSEFEKAAELLNKIKDETGSLPRHLDGFLEQQPELTANWNAEKELRVREEATGTLPQVEFITTKGRIVIELFENQAPNSVAHFLDMVENGYYDGLSFYEVAENGLALTGTPNVQGVSMDDYLVNPEHQAEEARSHHRGTVSLVTLLDGKYAGKVAGPVIAFCRITNLGLDQQHTALGRVIEGMPVIDRLNNSVNINDEGLPERVEEFDPDRVNVAKIIRPSSNPQEPNRVSNDASSEDNDN